MNKLVLAITFIMLIFNCTSREVNQPATEWAVSTPEEQGIDSEPLCAMLEKVKREKLPVHNILLIRNGNLITEFNNGESTGETKHPIYSGTKSITSILTGIAIDQGLIKSVDQKVLDFFPEWADQKKDDPYWNELTVKHLLTMSFGHETNSLPTMRIYNEPDFNALEFIFNTEIVNEPGTVFLYDNGSPHVLSAIIQKAAGMPMEEYARQKLFTLLGITDYSWDSDNQGHTIGNTSLQLRPYDLAKIAAMMLNNGRWQGKQIVSRQWVRGSTLKYKQPDMNEAEDFGYGYLWWINSFGGFSAHGFMGQFIFVIPRSNLIGIFTGAFEGEAFPVNHNLFRDFVIPAVRSDKAINPNPDANKRLAELIAGN